MIRKFLALATSLLCCVSLLAQLTVPPDGGNKKASVSERIGITDVTIHYDRPAVKGREGKIWNGLVYQGFKDLGFGTSKAAPWRAGANENTTITFSTDAMVEGKELKAGTYGFFVAMGAGDATLIFSNNNSAWGSFFYDPKEDAARVTVRTIPLAENIERLKYEFSDETDSSAIIALSWEKLKIPLKVEVDYVKTQIQSFRNELKGAKGLKPEAWQQAAQFSADNNVNLEEGLRWIDYALTGAFIGEKGFRNYATKADILVKLGKSSEANAAMKEAMALAGRDELHQYGRHLLQQKRNKEALEVFKANAQRNGYNYTTYIGLARGYAANGDLANAIKNAELGYAIASNAAENDLASKLIADYKEGKVSN